MTADHEPKPPSPPLINRFALGIGRPITRAFLRFCYRLSIDGHDHVPRRGPVIVVANHQSHFDPILLGLLVKDRYFRPIARKSLWDHRAVAAILHAYWCVAVDQEGTDRKAIKTAIDIVNAGNVFMIYPEGSRTYDGRLAEFQRGFMLILKKTGAPILPVAIEGAYDVWPRSQSKPRLHGRIAVRAAPIITHQQAMALRPADFMSHLRHQLETMRLDLRLHLRLRSNGRYPMDHEADTAFWQCTQS